MKNGFLPALLAAVVSAPASAFTALNESIDLNCEQSPQARLQCRYRPLQAGAYSSITAGTSGRTAAVSNVEPYPWTGARTVFLVMVDTSDPGRAPVIAKNVTQIEAIVGAARPHQGFGLAAFDKQMRLLATPGSSAQQIGTAARSLQAAGMTTELYRSLLQGIAVLSQSSADRRALLVFSDGQAEDRAYFHEDVVQAARKSGVVIISLGFGRTVALSVALQTLRRLSEDTGGLYLEADAGFNLPADFARTVLGSVEGGGRFNVDLAPLLQAGAPPTVQLAFTGAAGKTAIEMPLSPPEARVTAVAPQAAPAVVPPVARETPAARDELEQWLWYGVPAALTLLLVLTLFILVLITRRTAPPTRRPALKPVEEKALAYLVSQDDKARRFPITRTIWRIGRGADNEMVLDDSSVSRRHAEIKRSENGTFTVYDRNSLNGVYVNASRTPEALLTEGDIIEIGDIVLRFTETPADEHLQEQTSVQNTRAPRIS